MRICQSRLLFPQEAVRLRRQLEYKGDSPEAVEPRRECWGDLPGGLTGGSGAEAGLLGGPSGFTI